MSEVEIANNAEVFGILGIREWITPLNIIDPKAIEPRRDEELILQRKVDAFALATVT